MVVNHYLGRIGVLQCLYSLERHAQGCYLCERIVEAVTQGFNLTLMNEWLIALHIDDNIPCTAQLFYSFGNAVGTTFMVSTCHNSTSTKLYHSIVYALIIGGYINIF